MSIEEIMQQANEAKHIQDLALLKQCGWVGNKLIHWEGCECDWEYEQQREYDRSI